MNDLLRPALDPALVKAIAKVAEEYLGADHAVTKAFGAAVTSADPAIIEMARNLLRELPSEQRNMIWLTAKSQLASTKSNLPVKMSDLPYTADDLSPNRVLH